MKFIACVNESCKTRGAPSSSVNMANPGLATASAELVPSPPPLTTTSPLPLSDDNESVDDELRLAAKNSGK